MKQALASFVALVAGALPALGFGGGITATPAGNRAPKEDPNVPPEASPGGGMSLQVYTVHLNGGVNGTGTGYWEEFTVYAPDQSKPRPMLVAFHKYGVSQNDIWVNTTFFEEAMERGWYVLAPLSASGVHMGSIEGQINTEKAIEWMLDNFNINRDRIYGVGFSMGAGAVANFAARHLDPTKCMFAAIVDHTGGIAHVDTYYQSPSTQFVFDFWFGDGSEGSWDPFLMARSCLLDFDIHPTVVDPTTNLARNLVHVPTKVTRASIEPQATAYLGPQCDVFVSHLSSLGGQVKYEIVPYFGHSWAMLDEFKTLNWLSKRRLTLPTSHDTLADGDGRYFHFTVRQDAAMAFTPFIWGVDTTGNALTLSGTSNLTALEVDMTSAGLSGTQTFTLNLSTADGLADEVSLRGWPAMPTAVFRDGIELFTSWVYDDVEQLLTLQEPDGTQPHQWVVTP
jgi:S-formylglutathione hydrolase FrmB